MNRIICFISISQFLIFCSCNLKEVEKQALPNYDYSLVNEIQILNNDSEIKKTIINKNSINSLNLFFKDSSNYFKDEPIKLFSSSEKLYILKFKSNKENINLVLSKTDNPLKIEVGYFNQKEYKENPSTYRKYNRFYINHKIIDLIQKTQDKNN